MSHENFVRDCSAKVGRENVFILTDGNEGLHEIAYDNVVIVVKFATSRNLMERHMIRLIISS
jgi:hypothetical protein